MSEQSPANSQMDKEQKFLEWLQDPMENKHLDSLDPLQTRVVLGMSGGIDSAAAAFLLKKRGFQCIGVGMITLDEPKIFKLIEKKRHEAWQEENKFTHYKMKGKNKFKFNKEEDGKFLEGNCSVKDLDAVKRVCDHLNMPFYGVNSQDEFEEAILDPLVASKLSGECFFPCNQCSQLKINLLLRKAFMLEADYIATGHYSKIYRNEKEGLFYLTNSNDKIYDQSYLLSNLKQEQLRRLVLPLADIRRSEVHKIIDKFQIPATILRDSRKNCFISNGNLAPFIESRSPDKLRPIGSLVEKKTQMQLGEHRGIHEYFVGQTDIEEKITRPQLNNDKKFYVTALDPLGKIIVGMEDDLYSLGCSVNDLNVQIPLDRGKPLHIYVKTHLSLDMIPATLYFKNNNTCFILFKKRVSGLIKGQNLAFYNKNDLGAKMIGGGVIYSVGNLDVLSRTRELEIEQRDDQGNVIPVKVTTLKF